MIGSIDGDHSIQLDAVNGHHLAQEVYYAVDVTHLQHGVMQSGAESTAAAAAV